MVRKAMRMPVLMEATGLCKASIYNRIADGIFPPGRKLDPNGRAVIWFEDEIEAVQNGTWKAPPQTEAA
jgi:predicted DNA-binding transcriptional regulator AlpA